MAASTVNTMPEGSCEPFSPPREELQAGITAMRPDSFGIAERLRSLRLPPT
ncbi:hypothetical protein [Streptomyces mutabilis]|uniref:hypothetical protein n=1 Tax=Streptomyces mutabilis TaxID=67332 RepID=UPI0036B82C57